MEDLDEDLFLENIDAEVGDNNEKEWYVEEDDPLDDDDDLNLSKAEFEKTYYRFRAYNAEGDMKSNVQGWFGIWWNERTKDHTECLHCEEHS